jgi:hypothetical protein
MPPRASSTPHRRQSPNGSNGSAQAVSMVCAPDLETFVGLSFQYADYTMRHGQTEPGPPSIVSTVKINQAGFTEMMDTEAMFRKWFRQARANRLLP